MNATTSSVVTRCHVVWSYGGVLAAVLLGATICAAGDTAAADSADARRVEESVRWAKELGEACRARLRAAKKVTTTPPLQPSAIVEMGRHVRETRGPDLGNALIYYRAVHAWLALDEKAFADEEQKSKGAGVFLPDLLLYKVSFCAGLLADDTAKRGAAWQEYGRICPISAEGQGRDASFAPMRSFPNPPLPFVPELGGNEDRLVTIGDLYAGRGLYERAVDSYVESVFSTPRLSETNKGSTWLTVGKIETQLGQPQLALRAYLQAVYESPDLYGRVRKGIADVFRTKPSARKEPARGELTVEAAMKIAELYRQCNVHPFALRVLSEV